MVKDTQFEYRSLLPMQKGHLHTFLKLRIIKFISHTVGQIFSLSLTSSHTAQAGLELTRMTLNGWSSHPSHHLTCDIMGGWGYYTAEESPWLPSTYRHLCKKKKFQTLSGSCLTLLDWKQGSLLSPGASVPYLFPFTFFCPSSPHLDLYEDLFLKKISNFIKGKRNNCWQSWDLWHGETGTRPSPQYSYGEWERRQRQENLQEACLLVS